MISCLLHSTAFGEKTTTFKLVSDDCQITAVQGTGPSTKSGDKVTMECTLKSKKFSCGQPKKELEQYQEPVVADGFIFAKSGSGNVYILMNTTKEVFQIASTHLVPAEPEPLLLTKLCTGKIK